MAKSNDSTILWIAALGIGGYLLWKNTQPAPNATASQALPVVNQAGPVLQLPSGTALSSSAPPGSSPNQSSAPPGAASSAPPVNPANVTNLVPVSLNSQGQPNLLPGQTLAANGAGQLITNANGQLMAFTSVNTSAGQFANINTPAAQKWVAIDAKNLALIDGLDGGN